MSQINLIISPQKEEELIKYITEKCDCFIFYFSEPQKTHITNVFFVTWHIVPILNKIPLKNKECGIYKCDDDFFEKYVYDHPRIEYNRFLFGKDAIEQINGRFYYSPPILHTYSPITKEVYRNICKWIKKNSINVERSEGIPIYDLNKKNTGGGSLC